MIIQRRADHLQPGDILPASHNRARRVIISIHPAQHMVDGFTCFMAALAPNGSMVQPPAPESFDRFDAVDVEVRDLTPAQAHAEELLDLTRKVSEHASAFLAVDARLLLDKIEPKPPTLEEALRALDGIDPDHMPPSSKRVLEQARRAGML